MEPGGLLAEVSWWRMEYGYDDFTADVERDKVRERKKKDKKKR